MKPNYKNVKYGQLVELLLNDGGYHAGVKIHFFNKKGVLVGNVYEFVPYDRIRFRTDNPAWVRRYYGKRFESIRQVLYEMLCQMTTLLIRATQHK